MIDRRNLLGLASAGLAIAGGARASPTNAEEPPTSLSAAVRSSLDALLEGRDTAGGIIVAAHRGKTAAVYTWGKASLPFDVPVTASTLFHIASNGKRFTAWAILQLIEAGKITAYDPIGRHVANLPPSVAGVSIDQLMHHVSGLPDYANILTDWDRPQPRDAVIKAIETTPLDFPPGARFAYSNTNYLVLGWLIEDVTGTSYTDYLHEHLFKPANLPRARTDAAQHVIPLRAEPYYFDEGNYLHAPLMEDGVSRAPDGGILFSAVDLAPWASAMFTPKLLSPESVRLAVSPGTLSTGRRIPYACALFSGVRNGHRTLTHSGWVPASSVRGAFGRMTISTSSS